MSGKPNDKVFKTMVKKHGSEEAARAWYRELGAKGGRNGHTGGFYTREECNCSTFRFTHTKPMCAGAKGGAISRRVSKKVPQNA